MATPRCGCGTRSTASSPRLLLFGRAGFTREVTQAATNRSDLELVDLDRVYRGT